MDSSYDFNAPQFRDLNAQSGKKVIEDANDKPSKFPEPSIELKQPEKIVEAQPLPTEKTPKKLSVANVEQIDVQKETPNKGAEIKKTPVSVPKKAKNTPNKSANKIIAKQGSIETSHRQSPRLVEMSKANRRQVASRGYLPTRKRSISESELGGKLSTIGKKVPTMKKKTVLQGLNSACSKDLSDIATITKVMSNNRKRSAQPHASGPTKPQGFQLATDARFGNKNKVSTTKTPQFTRTLRSNSECDLAATKGLTKPKPFHLHESRKIVNSQNKFVSMAELNLKFQTKTPDRFRTTKSKVPELEKCQPKATIPHTPKLTSNKRSRPVDYPTREEEENKEIEEAQKFKFKAQPLSKKVLEEPKLPVVSKRKITVPTPFGITDEVDKPSEVEKSEAGLLELYSSSNYIDHKGIAKECNPPRMTKIKPFSFADRDSEILRKKQEKIEKELEEEKRLAEFHAHPMPKFGETPKLPPKKAKTPVKLTPFHMYSDQRGETKQKLIQQHLQQQEEEEKSKRHFVARKPVSIQVEPFIPEKPRRYLTDISSHELNTAERAKEREAFDIKMKEKEYEILALQKEREELRKKEEELEVKRLRQEATHKAKPVPVYKPFEVKHSALPATVPAAPQFATSKRLRSNSISSNETYTA